MPAMTATFQQQAYDFVKAKITTLGFKPGEYLTDAQIAGQLNISRTPVREAFHRLENEGLLNYEQRRGWKVYALALTDIEEIFDIKIAVEGLIARRAADCADEELKTKLGHALQQMAAAAQDDNINAWFQADQQFHDTLYRMADNDRARRVIDNLNAQWHRVRIGFSAMQSRVKSSVGEHQAIAASILAGNGEQAELHMRIHLQQVRDELVRLLANMVMPFVENGV